MPREAEKPRLPIMDPTRWMMYPAERFRCRKCFGLVYSSNPPGAADRADTMADKLALKICGGDERE